MKESVLNALNNQINMEFYASNAYLQYAAWADNQGLSGCADFLRTHSEEERQHMEKIYTYVIDSGEMPILGSIDAPETSFNSVEHLFKIVLKHEESVTASINALYELAFTEKDFATANFMQWFINEQHEEENLVNSVLDRIALIGLDSPSALYLIDQEVPKVTVTQSIT